MLICKTSIANLIFWF